MTYVITQTCCNDASCVSVCPVNCIHPTPSEREFLSTEMLYIDPATCIDCGACVDACPVNAIRLDTELSAKEQYFKEINARWYVHHPIEAGGAGAPAASRRRANFAGLRVAIVGSGPAAHYAAAEILSHAGTEVDMYEKLLTPYGLIRAGVAPDHPGTKGITEQFRRTADRPGFHLHLGVEIGRDLSHADLLAHHSAVIYAVGASSDRRLGIPGEDLPGSHAASEFVAWYNGHPDHNTADFNLSGTRAVIVGNGNVALDIARILVAGAERLETTDIAEHALAALRTSNIREVVILGRRGPAQAAYTTPELHALLHLQDVDLVVDPAEAMLDDATQFTLDKGLLPTAARLKTELVAEIARAPARGANKRIVLRYLASPVGILGTGRVTGLRIARNQLEAGEDGNPRAVATGSFETIETTLVLRSVGYRGTEIAGVPFDRNAAVIPNKTGRVLDSSDGSPIPGVYATGWIKRGPTGVIGTNKRCANETVGALLDDFESGTIRTAVARASLAHLFEQRCPNAIDLSGWRRIDDAERAAGAARNKPRLKLVDHGTLRDGARPEA